MGFAVASIKPPAFASSATILARNASNAPVPGVTSTARALVANQKVAATVIEELKLGNDPWRLTPANLVQDHLRVDDVPGTFLLRLVVTFPDRDLAAALANGLAREAIALNNSLNAQTGSGVEGLLQSELTTARTRMIEAEQRLATVREAIRSQRSARTMEHPEQEEARAHAEYDLARRLYDEVAVQYGRLRLQIAEKTIDLAVVEPAYPAALPVSPSRPATAFFGAVGALTFATVAVVLFTLVRAPTRVP